MLDSSVVLDLTFAFGVGAPRIANVRSAPPAGFSMVLSDDMAGRANLETGAPVQKSVCYRRALVIRPFDRSRTRSMVC